MALRHGVQLAAALICERVEIDATGSPSLVRLLDHVDVTTPGGSPPMPHVTVPLVLFVAFTRGRAEGPATVRVTMTTPGRETLEGGKSPSRSSPSEPGPRRGSRSTSGSGYRGGTGST